MASTYQRILSVRERRGAGFLVLLDPDKLSVEKAVERARLAEEGGADGILVGGSLLFFDQFDAVIRAVKRAVDLPVIIFPGSTRQISREADAILFLMFISSRNPDYLIGEQVMAAPILRSLGLEAISTAYMHVESGNITTVEFFSGSRPIPRNKSEIAVAHALAAEYLGMKLIYLEAGSGAKLAVPDEMVAAVTREVSIPVIVGGGIRGPEDAARKVEAGAGFVVIGNVLEKDPTASFVRGFADAIHQR